MKIVLICNNYGQKFDGIGAYSHKIYSGFDVDVCTAITRPEKNFMRIFGLGMSISVLKASIKLMSGHYANVIIEYPFVEWNPLFCFVVLWLKLITIVTKVNMVVSLHEFVRVNYLRRVVIIYLALLADTVLVTEKENFRKLKEWNDNIHKIEIPSNIEFSNDVKVKDTKQFVFFGIVNKAKAFNEMLEAWDIFNENKEYKLVILTSSKLDGMENHKNVEYVYNASDEEVKNIMLESAFSIVPIKPYVDEKNATFKASCLAGCVSIGKFCDEYKRLHGVKNLDNYTTSSFLEIFNECKSVCVNEVEEFQKNIREYSRIFTIENTRCRIMGILGDDSETFD